MNTYTKEIAEYIARLNAHGDNVCIMGHHYQAQDIVTHCHITGDSLELARKVQDITAPHIIFCGVYFMAESAALLARPGQHIYIPDVGANCVMSQMTPAPLLEKVVEKLCSAAKKEGRTLIPLAYVNTSLAVKAVVGKYGGAVCTSANAQAMLTWALKTGEQVLFLPDKNLAQNTAQRIGIPQEQWHVLDIRGQGTRVDMDAAAKARLLMWPGCCAIHAKFTPKRVQDMRDKYPQCRIAVHPECHPHVVNAADAAGSTSLLIDYVAQSPKNSTVIIGTETNLVERLRMRHAEHCHVIPLREAYCSHMAKITGAKLLQTLKSIDDNTSKPVRLPEDIITSAKASLERMLAVR